MEHYENFKEELQIRTAHAEEIIRRYLPEEAGFARTMAEAMNYSMCAGGKRLRPILLLETFRMFGEDERVAEPFMAGIEMIHTPMKPELVPMTIGSFPPIGPIVYTWISVTIPATSMAF